MTHFPMSLSVASSAKRNEIAQIVVALISGFVHTIAVHVMHMQVFFASAALACMVVTLKCGGSVATKSVVVLCGCCVLFRKIRVVLQPLVNFFQFFAPLTFLAADLRSGPIFKVITAIFAQKNGSDWRCARSLTKTSEMFSITFGSERGATRNAYSLRRPGWFKLNSASFAGFWGKSISGLRMSTKRARFAAFHVWRSFVHGHVAIRACKNSVLSHDLVSMKLASSHYSR